MLVGWAAFLGSWLMNILFYLVVILNALIINLSIFFLLGSPLKRGLRQEEVQGEALHPRPRDKEAPVGIQRLKR